MLKVHYKQIDSEIKKLIFVQKKNAFLFMIRVVVIVTTENVLMK